MLATAMIYCVVPPALADELFEKLTAHYADDPNVTVIIDQRAIRAARARGRCAGRISGASCATAAADASPATCRRSRASSRGATDRPAGRQA